MTAVLRIRAPPRSTQRWFNYSAVSGAGNLRPAARPTGATHPRQQMTASAQGQQGAGRRCSLTRKNPTMLCDRHPDCPQPGDIAQLTRGNSIGADPTDSFVIVEDFPPTGRHLVLNLPVDHPGRADWAAAVPLADIATLTRLEPAGSRTWAPAPDPDDIQ